MTMISVQQDFDKLTANLGELAKSQVPFATSRALNDTAAAVRTAAALGAKGMTARPFTTSENALFVIPSTKTNLVAVVGYKDIQARYLKWQIGGGRRVAKAYEVKLAAMGVLPPGYVTVPGAGVTLDMYGDIPMATITTILGMLASGLRIYKGRGKRMHEQGVFVVRPGSSDHRVRHLKPGIYQRLENTKASVIRPLIMFVTAASYQAGKFFDLDAIVARTAASTFPAAFEQRMAEAMATAK